MSKNRDRTMSPSSLSEGSDAMSHTQKETSGTMLNRLFAAPPMTEEQKKLQSLEEKIDILGTLRIASVISFFMFTGATMLFLWVPIKYLGIPFYSFILGFHSLSLAILSIVQYYLIPPLIDERCIISFKVQEESFFPPAYHPSKNEMIWRYLRLFVVFVSDLGIWKFLSHMELPDNLEDMKNNGEEMFICLLLGLFLVAVSLPALFLLGRITVHPESMKYIITEGEDDTDKRTTLMDHKSSRELKAENFEDIRKLRNEMRERDKEKDKIIMELSQDVKRLRRQRTTK